VRTIPVPSPRTSRHKNSRIATILNDLEEERLCIARRFPVRGFYPKRKFMESQQGKRKTI
jgi:hypothetical protein